MNPKYLQLSTLLAAVSLLCVKSSSMRFWLKIPQKWKCCLHQYSLCAVVSASVTVYNIATFLCFKWDCIMNIRYLMIITKIYIAMAKII